MYHFIKCNSYIELIKTNYIFVKRNFLNVDFIKL